MTDRFSICLPFTLAQECPHPNDWSNPKNFSNDAHDPGGVTWAGITQREYDSFRKKEGLVCQDVRHLTENDGRMIYYHNYWLPHCDSLPPGLDLQFFDASVNEGCTEAVRILQRVLLLGPDGLWGPKTAEQVQFVITNNAVRLAIEAFTSRRKEVYRESKGFYYFGKDWLRRADEIGAEALKMIST